MIGLAEWAFDRAADRGPRTLLATLRRTARVETFSSVIWQKRRGPERAIEGSRTAPCPGGCP